MNRTNDENFELVMLYAECGSDAAVAQARFRELYPDEEPPSVSTFERLIENLRSTGSFGSTLRSCRKPVPSTVRIFEEFAREPSLTVQEVSRRLGINKMFVRRVRDFSMYRYKYVRTQFLAAEDFEQRMNYSTWLLGNIERNPSFCKHILFTDEALFTREWGYNPHDSYMWNDESPLTLLPRPERDQWSVNLWAGICGESVIGPFILPDKFDDPTYKDFLEHDLPGLLDEIPLEIRKDMYFQLDGAPAHCATAVRAYLNENFPNKWIGPGGSVVWPSQSPEFNPVHFFFWECLKSSVYRKRVNTREKLIARINDAVAEFKSKSMLQQIQSKIQRRAQACVHTKGSYIEHILAIYPDAIPTDST